MRCVGVGGAHVPVGDQLHAVGIDGREQQDVVVQDAQGFGVAAGEEVVGLGEQRLRGNHFVGVQAAIDPHDGFALRGEGVRLIVGETFGTGQALRDLFVAREVFEIGGRGDDGHDDGAAFGGLADLLQLDAVGFRWRPCSSSRGAGCSWPGSNRRRRCRRRTPAEKWFGRTRRPRPELRRRTGVPRLSQFFDDGVHLVTASFLAGWMVAGSRTPVPYFSMVRVFML